MSNEWTDQLRLALIRDVKHFLPFPRLRNAMDGWSQVVFRGRQCIGEISPISVSLSPVTQRGNLIKVRDGDTIICVYRSMRLHHLTGTISTKDRYKRIYDIPVSLEVNSPIDVAKAYYHEKDPVGQIVSQIKSRFEKFAYSYSHDQIINGVPPFDKWSTEEFGNIGITVRVDVNRKSTFREDPSYSDATRSQLEKKALTEKLALDQELQKIQEEIKYKQEKTQKQYEFAKQTIERDFARQERTKEQVHTICSDLLQVVAKGMEETLKERVHEGFAKGDPTSLIWNELFTVLYALGDDNQQINLEQRIMAHMEEMQKLKMKSAAPFEDDTAASTPETDPSLDIVEDDEQRDGSYH